MRRTLRWAMLATLVVAGACTSGDEAVDTTVAATAVATTTTTSTTTLPPPPELEVDRLVIVDGAGQVVAMDRDGANPTVLSAEGDVPFQPVWSPDAEAVAYASRAGSPEFIVTAASGGSTPIRATLDTPPFYFYWSPTGGELRSLRNSLAGGLAHERFVVGDELRVTEIDGGAPYYFSWKPDGSSTVAHVGIDRLDLIAVDGEREALDVVPGAFQAPQWTHDGIVAAVIEDDAQSIARIAGDEVEHLVDVDGSVVFAVSASGRYLAVQSLNPDADAVSVAFVDEELPPNRLEVIDLESGDRSTVTSRPVVSFFWSPALERLLIIEAAGNAGQLVMSVWENGELTEGPTFVVGRQWLGEFLPFFDQYAQSMSLWAPDAGAYAFTGSYEGERGIFVVDVASNDVSRAADGTWVAWSPR